MEKKRRLDSNFKVKFNKLEFPEESKYELKRPKCRFLDKFERIYSPSDHVHYGLKKRTYWESIELVA